MWLEHELLSKPGIPGFFCITTSYRNEPNPIPGRHELIFPMFEFETHGDQRELQKLETELLEFIGLGKLENFVEMEYAAAASHCESHEIHSAEEARLGNEFGPVFFLKNFPIYTSPFWNMRKEGDVARKIDVLLYGVETIGSAERSCDPVQMRELFHTISDGGYAKLLYEKFGRERVEAELEKFLALNFFPRCGGGIGITRMIRAFKLAGIL
ncbi:MAG: transposase [Candidatus Magasanikbacteria bacterium]|nr:transposase [Candidatus Magasanikbacteria bacterium]